MASNEVENPLEFFVNQYGDALESGKIYIGQVGLDPVTNPKTAYFDRALTVTAAQPIRTVAGVPSLSGAAKKIFTDGAYSVKVTDQNDVLIYTSLVEGVLDVGGGNEVDTFADLDALTADDVAVGAYVRVTSIGAAYQAVSSGQDFTTAGGLKVVNALGPVSGYNVAAFGGSYPIALGAGHLLTGGGIGGPTITIDSDIQAITALGTSSSVRVDDVKITDVSIIVEAGVTLTDAPVQFQFSAFPKMENVYVLSDDYQSGVGVQIGGADTDYAYAARAENVKVRGFETSFLFHSAGSGAVFDNCYSYPDSTTGDGGTIEIRTPNALILGGQHKHVLFNRVDNGEEFGGEVRNQSVEAVETGTFWAKITGDTVSGNASSRWKNVEFSNITFNGAVMAGTGLVFDRAHDCSMQYICKNPTDAGFTGYIAQFTANSSDCRIICDAESAAAPWLVDAGATRAVKFVNQVVPNSKVVNITTSANGSVELAGVVELPADFRARHNGVAWNYQLVSLADDTATTLSPPATQFRITIMRGEAGKTAHWFEGIVDTGTDTVTTIFAGASFEVLTGVLDGTTTGTNNKTGISCSGGTVYVQARNGTTKLTILYQPVVYA